MQSKRKGERMNAIAIALDNFLTEACYQTMKLQTIATRLAVATIAIASAVVIATAAYRYAKGLPLIQQRKNEK